MALPLEGLTVVDLTAVVSGSVATMLMAEFGANVIKVEPPGGEAYRRFGTAIWGPGNASRVNLLRWTRGKRSVVVDLKTKGGQEVLWRLVDRADVLIENMRPGALARLGFDPDTLRQRNPRLVYSTVSGFGHPDVLDSELSSSPAYAIVVEAMAGLTSLARDSEGTPTWLGFAMADIFSGVLSFAGTLLALRQRDLEDGGGRRVDVAMFDGAAFMNDLPLIAYSLLGQVETRYRTSQPWGVYRAKDGHFVIAVMTPDQWASLCAVIGRPDLVDDERMASGISRAQVHEEVIAPAIEAWALGRPKDEIARELDKANVPSAAVNNAQEVYDSAQLRSREMLVDALDPEGDVYKVVGNPIKLTGMQSPPPARVPQLGEHTRTVLVDEFGMSEEEYKTLLTAGAISEYE